MYNKRANKPIISEDDIVMSKCIQTKKCKRKCQQQDTYMCDCPPESLRSDLGNVFIQF